MMVSGGSGTLKIESEPQTLRFVERLKFWVPQLKVIEVRFRENFQRFFELKFLDFLLILHRFHLFRQDFLHFPRDLVASILNLSIFLFGFLIFFEFHIIKLVSLNLNKHSILLTIEQCCLLFPTQSDKNESTVFI